MYYQTCCSQTTIDEWQQLMKGARKASYKRLVQRVKRELPDLYKALALNFYNPYWEQCKQTKTHYIHTHTIGRIGKDCQVITGTHGTFMAVDIAVDDYSRGKNITTWVRVRSSRENHVRLAEYLTKGRLILVEGTISTSQWKDRQGESHTQISINADSIAFVNAGKKEEQNADPKKAAKKEHLTRRTCHSNEGRRMQ